MSYPPKPLTKERILENIVVSPTGCWEWQGCCNSGYGVIRVKAIRLTPLRVHRVAAHLWLGKPLESKEVACHTCDNRRCVNPEHLFFGTIADNNRDCLKKGRHFSPSRGKTHCIRGHEFTPENTHVHKGERRCRACARFYFHRRKLRLADSAA